MKSCALLKYEEYMSIQKAVALQDRVLDTQVGLLLVQEFVD